MLDTRYARRNPNYGRGEHTIDHVECADIEDDLVQEVIRTFQAPGYEPPMLPTVAVQLLELSRRPDASTDEIAKLLESDPMLYARVLRMAQSAMFGGHPVKTTRDALIRLGRKTVGDVVMAAALNMRVFRHDKYAARMESIRSHSMTTARIGDFLANYAKVGRDYVFISGLLHDVGAACTMLVIGKIEGGVPDELLDGVLRRCHSKISGLLVALWGLPNIVEQVVTDHDQRSPDKLTAVITVAEHLATMNDAGWNPPMGDTVEPAVVTNARSVLGLSDGEWRAVERRATQIALEPT